MMFKKGASNQWEGISYDYIVAENQSDIEKYLADGWKLTIFEINEPEKVTVQVTLTKDELIKEAEERGIDIDKRWSIDKIQKALNGMD